MVATMAQRIPIGFYGFDAGIEEVTWAQRTHWHNAEISGVTESAGGMMQLAEGTTVEDIVKLLRYIMSRHQALRTRIFVDAQGNLKQEVITTGAIELEVVDADDTADPAVIAEALRVAYDAAKWDFANELPVRMAVVRQRGLATHFVAMYSNICIDAYGIDALTQDLSNMDQATGAPLAPPAGVKPLELARLQQTPTAKRQSQSSLRHWERILREIEPRRFDESPDKRTPRYWECSLRSKAMVMALQIISERCNVHSGTVMLAAYAVVLARISRRPKTLVRTIVSNRFRPGFQPSVSNLAQGGLCLVDVSDCTFDTAVDRTFKSQLSTGMHSYFDPRDVWAVTERVSRERGAELDLWVAYNDRRRVTAAAPPHGPPPTRDQVLEAMLDTEFTWTRRWDNFDATTYLILNQVPGMVECLMHADTHSMSPDQLESACRGLESLLVEAAFDPQTATRVHAVVPAK
jgi:Condensation domain